MIVDTRREYSTVYHMKCPIQTSIGHITPYFLAIIGTATAGLEAFMIASAY
jgi:hypothetical protein